MRENKKEKVKKEKIKKEKVKKNKNTDIPKQGKKKNKVLIVVLVIVLLFTLLVGALAIKAMRIRAEVEASKNSEVKISETVNDETKEPNNEIIEEKDKPVDEVVELKEPEDEEVIKEEIYDYENNFIGIKFNYDTNMYRKENTDIVFNTLKSVSEGGKNFRINKDKLNGSLNILQLTTGESDGLLITVSLLPFEIANKSDIKVDDTEVIKESQAEIPEITDEMLKEYDEKLKSGLNELGATVDVFENSFIKETNGLKSIISERKYSGGGAETKTGVTDVIQGLVPIGVNAVLVTAITDGSPIEIDKTVLFDEIIESLVIMLPETDNEEITIVQ